MRKCPKSLIGGLLVCLLNVSAVFTHAAVLADVPISPYGVLSRAMVDRARNDLVRIKALVEQGSLPKSKITEAEAALADAEDEQTLSETLYGSTPIQSMTPDQAKVMVEAAQRRVDREEPIVTARRALLEQGIIAKSELTDREDELASRQQTLVLAINRAKVIDELKAMANAEQALERLTKQGPFSPQLKDVMIRYGGNGSFTLNDLTPISAQFQKKFKHALPISALGQTMVHQSMGLDHRNRVDVALNPDQPEGVWLRQLLESLHVPYLAFRSAVSGAATAPHIHIGLESTRLKLAQR